MLKHDHEHYAEHAEFITDERHRGTNREAYKEAFWYLVAFAAALKDFECEIRYTGKGKRSFRFYWRGRNSVPFSFIINQNKGLLFYIRKPALEKGVINKSQVIEEFSDLEKEDKGDEISIRINNPSVAARITKFVFDSSSR
jgi:hypothetical protein